MKDIMCGDGTVVCPVLYMVFSQLYQYVCCFELHTGGCLEKGGAKTKKKTETGW